jgi:hypothetical protein
MLGFYRKIFCILVIIDKSMTSLCYMGCVAFISRNTVRISKFSKMTLPLHSLNFFVFLSVNQVIFCIPKGGIYQWASETQTSALLSLRDLQ